LVRRWAEDPETDRREALDLVRRAVKTAPDDPEVLVWAAGTLDLVGEDIGPSLAMLDHALILNPSSAFGWVWSGFLRLFAGSTETAIKHFEKSLRLDPRTPLRPFHHTGLGACYFLQRRFDEAAALLAGSLRQVPTYPYGAAGRCRGDPGPFAVDRISSDAAAGTGSSRSRAARVLGLGPATRGGRGGLTATAVKFGSI
jgi:tetratricopeptide (TPR) repeat protein